MTSEHSKDGGIDGLVTELHDALDPVKAEAKTAPFTQRVLQELPTLYTKGAVPTDKIGDALEDIAVSYFSILYKSAKDTFKEAKEMTKTMLNYILEKGMTEHDRAQFINAVTLGRKDEIIAGLNGAYRAIFNPLSAAISKIKASAPETMMRVYDLIAKKLGVPVGQVVQNPDRAIPQYGATLAPSGYGR